MYMDMVYSATNSTRYSFSCMYRCVYIRISIRWKEIEWFDYNEISCREFFLSLDHTIGFCALVHHHTCTNRAVLPLIMTKFCFLFHSCTPHRSKRQPNSVKIIHFESYVVHLGLYYIVIYWLTFIYNCYREHSQFSGTNANIIYNEMSKFYRILITPPVNENKFMCVLVFCFSLAFGYFLSDISKFKR